MAAGVLVQRGLGGLPARVPNRFAVFNVKITAPLVQRAVVVPVACQPQQAGVTVKAVPTGGARHQAEKILTAQIINPWQRCHRCLNDILPFFVVEMAILHSKDPP
ncbi:hypothetical protein SDC9_96632 [bioreactor metagenome]|uniref:Uncharacterized protein n=1 Tax=bioreactor metagenome TaxID=1076179 RepID=A0A645AB26_9ZZZZ